jgi:type IV pilus assembly protein PilY1
MIYQAKFNSGDWSGHLLAFAIDNSNGSIGASATWDAAGKIPAANNRQIFTFNTDSSATVKGIRFEWDGLSSSQQTALKTSDSDSLGPQRLDYLRGIRTQERQNGGTFRNRGNLLGDIVNSDPLFVGVENHGNQWLPGVEGSSYLAFRNNEDYLNRRKMIYVGANDGMLHAFNAEKASANAGTEVFAYVPHAVFDHLIDLTSPSYSHQYYVDGSPVVADVYFDGAWRTLLVGTTGAGGRGVFGLDVTDPTSFDENNVLWEFTQADDPDLGYTLSEPSIFRMQDGHWAVIVANGYNSDAGKAVLFILDAKDGGVIKKIDTESAGNGVVAKNGLSSPIAIDVNGDRIIDDIYAGDLLGNVWKFDVSSIHPADWDIAYEQDSSPAPLFVACANDSDPCLPADRQPITAKLQVGQVGASQTGGMMVYFGTGKYFEEGDEQAGSPPQMQTFYGIWDQNTGDSADDIFSDRASLQQQTIDFEATAVNSAGHTAAFIARVTSQNAVNYAEKRGWFLNFITPSGLLEGERVVSYPFLRNGRLLFTTLIPNSDLCSFGGSGWTMELEALTGNRLNSPTVDFFGKDGSASPDGNIGEEDKVFFDGGGYVASGEKSTSIPEMPGIAYTNLFEYRYQSQTDGSITTRKGLSGMTLGRQSWIQLR